MQANREISEYIRMFKEEGLPLLDREEEFRLARRAKRGDRRARERLFMANSRLVVLIAKRFMRKGLNLLDLVQEGNIGLLKAIERFDPRKGYKFCTYACWWIRHHIQKFVYANSRCVPIPVKKEELLRKIDEAFRRLEQEDGGRASSARVADALRRPQEQVDFVLNLAQPTVSLDADCGEDGTSKADRLSDPKWSVEDETVRRMMKESLRRVLDSLVEIERKVIMYRYGLVDGTRYTLKETSDMFRASPETIRRIEMSVLERIRREHADLRNYIDS